MICFKCAGGYAILKALTFGSLLLFSGLDKVARYGTWLLHTVITYRLKIGARIAALTAVVCLLRGILDPNSSRPTRRRGRR